MLRWVIIKAIDHSIYVSGRGAFWVHMCPAVHTQWTTPTSTFFGIDPDPNPLPICRVAHETVGQKSLLS